MTRWIPYPLSSFALAAMWLLLNGTLAPGQVALAACVGIGGDPARQVGDPFGDAGRVQVEEALVASGPLDEKAAGDYFAAFELERAGIVPGRGRWADQANAPDWRIPARMP